MQAASFEEVLKQILAKDPRYPLNVYLFVREALDHTQKIISKQAKGGLRHVTGQELLAGIRELALEQFGPMAMTVFEEWGIHSCRDFGEIVFNLVDHRVLARTEQDSRADFQNGYDFYEAFRKPFLPQNKVKSSGELPEPRATEA